MDSVFFEVGTQFENMKGLCEVMTLTGEQMRIRWLDSGEELNTTATAQKRILDFIQREQDERLKAPKNKRSGSLKEHGSMFNGLVETDFKNDVTGTTWRSRQQLGGAVTKLLTSRHATFESWSIYHQAAVHWADIGHRGKEHALSQAKLACFLNTNRMLCGFYVERSQDPLSPGDNWGQFLTWISDRDNLLWLHGQMRAQNLCITELCGRDHLPQSISPSPRNLTWEITRNMETTEEELDSFPNLLASIPFTQWVDLVIGKEVPKPKAVEQSIHVAADIAKVFNALMPAYEYIIKGTKP